MRLLLRRLLFVSHAISFVLAIACIFGLIMGIAYEARTHELLFENYLSTFSGSAIVFSIIGQLSKP